MPFQIFDAWDQSVLTDEITRPQAGRDPGAAEDQDFLLGQRLAPLKTHPARSGKIRVRELKPFGKGQFRAPNATPAQYAPGVTWSEQVISLALLDEIHPIDEEEWLKLNSADENIRRSAGVDLVERGRILKTRNDRLTEYMIWQMLLTGKLTISYPVKGSLVIDYGFTSGHLPTASTLWSTTATADPVADIQAYSEKLADDSGFYARYIHMNSKTFDYLIRNTKVVNAINFFASGAAPIQRPRRQDLLELFSSFAVNQEIVIYDNGYRDEGETGVGRPSLTKYLPDGKVLVTTNYTVNGTNFADMLDGQVQVVTGYNSTDIRQGFQAQVLLDQLSGTHYLRASAARIPRLLLPEHVLTATVA